MSSFEKYEYTMVQIIREIQLMKELNLKPGGDKFVPKLYDVLMQEIWEQKNGKSVNKLCVFLVMEHFVTDLREFIVTKLRSLNEH